MRLLFDRIREAGRQLWARAALYSVAGVVLALAAPWLSRVFNVSADLKLAAGSVGSLLNILASSMLAVTTFSLSIVRGAYDTAASSATPRAGRLLGRDTVANNALGTFMGTFLFSIFGIIGLSGGFYNDQSRVLLFGATLLVIVLVANAMIRWINVTIKFGRMSDTIGRIEEAAVGALTVWRDEPFLSCREAGDPPKEGIAVRRQFGGYVYNIDLSGLQAAAEKFRMIVHLNVQPGTFVYDQMIVAWIVSEERVVDEGALAALEKAMASAIDLELYRNFDRDPYAGMSVMTEVASRALSPAVNDPGTAIQVLESGMRALAHFFTTPRKEPRIIYDRIHMPAVNCEPLLRRFFYSIARDGASQIEVQVPLQRVIVAIKRRCDPQRRSIIQAVQTDCLAVANRALTVEEDRALLARAARDLEEVDRANDLSLTRAARD